MASMRQQRANRQNAKLSTGPRTAAGKTAVATNALKHGLQSQAVRLTWESKEEFEGFVAALRDDLVPVGAFEEAMVDSIVSALWRLARLTLMESGVITRHVALAIDSDAKSVNRDDYFNDNFGRLSSQQMRELPETLLGHAYLQDLRGFSALAQLDRYRRSLDCTIGASLKRLHDLQERRKSVLCEEHEVDISDEQQAKAS